LRNLKSARQVGMRTVHVFHPGTPLSSLHNGRGNYVDLRIHSFGKLLAGHRVLR
jgi:putative hydrolase of the HAD superfamily